MVTHQVSCGFHGETQRVRVCVRVFLSVSVMQMSTGIPWLLLRLLNVFVYKPDSVISVNTEMCSQANEAHRARPGWEPLRQL